MVDTIVSVAKFLYDPNKRAEDSIDSIRSSGLVQILSRLVEFFPDNCSREELEEIERKRLELNEFHQRSNVSGFELIQPEISSLDLDLSEEQLIKAFVKNSEGNYIRGTKTVFMKKVVEKVLKEINKQIQEKDNSDEDIIKLRCIQICDSEPPFSEFKQLGDPDGKWFTEDTTKQLWVHRVLQALVDKGQIFDFEVNVYGYLVQA